MREPVLDDPRDRPVTLSEVLSNTRAVCDR